jgi:Uma2 family endonuclease
MPSVSDSNSIIGWTVGDVFQRLGAIPFSRLQMTPPPGSATEQDVVDLQLRDDRLCELVDGLLLEKVMGSYESMLAMELGILLGQFIRTANLGRLLGESSLLRLAPGVIRSPDLSFVTNQQLAALPPDQGRIWELAPTLAVEVISRGNTAEEMQAKLRDYFSHGVREVWYVYPAERAVHVFANETTFRVFTAPEVLRASAVLPGLELDLARLFAPLGE